MIDATVQRLLAAAIAARRAAYAPYSHFSVGAALITRDGKTFVGANIENASYGLSMCAERVAVFTAVGAGSKYFDAIAIAGPDNVVTTPCGACRQVLVEFGTALRVIYRSGSQIKVAALSALLPEACTPEALTVAESGRNTR